MAESNNPGATRYLGVLGTLVWDTIHLHDSPRTVHAWGGIAYALTALEVGLPPGWAAVPIVKVGADIAAEARSYLDSFSCIDAERTAAIDGIRIVPERHNRVELTYISPTERIETLTGGVPGWSAGELAELLPSLNALYVNFISGFELELDAARQVRDNLTGPSYADLHSLFMDIAPDGRRTPRRLPSVTNLCRCFDSVQMNEAEFGLFGKSVRKDAPPWSLAQQTLGGRLGLIVVTRGGAGVDFLTLHKLPADSDRSPSVSAVPQQFRPQDGLADGDPTGCGDVWGATFFARFLAGDELPVAMGRAHSMARHKLKSRGAEQFATSLSGATPPAPK